VSLVVRRQFIIVDRLILTALSIVLSGCVSSNSVEERHVYWNDELSTFFEVSRSFSELSQWLVSHNIEHGAGPSEGTHLIRLEDIELNEVACKSWHFNLEVTVSADETIQDYSLEQAGVCL
jgi:hypothetical protein